MARTLGEAYGIIPSKERAAWIENGEWQHRNDLIGGNAATRRAFTSNADISASYGAVFAAQRLRCRMIRCWRATAATATC